MPKAKPAKEPETMTKREAAAHLNVHVRAIERYATTGRLHPTHVRGKFGQESRYLRSELDALLAEREAPVEISPPPNRALTAGDNRGLSGVSDARVWIETFARVLEQASAQSAYTEGQRLLLTVPEAAAATGLSETFISRACREGRLRSAKLGGAWRIRPVDLRAFIDEAIGGIEPRKAQAREL